MFKKLLLLPFLITLAVFAASSTTTHYNLDKPSDGDENWGTGYRANMNTIDTQMYSSSTSISDHIADTTAAHAASAISSTAGATVCTTSTDVQAFLTCLALNFGSLIGGDVATLTTNQTFTGQKTFSQSILGNLTGNVTGNTAGTHTGDVTGNLIGAVTTPAFVTAGLVHNDTSGVFSSSTLVNADVSSSAAIAYSKLALSNSILTGDITTGGVTSTNILDGTILNADVNASAAIAYSKLASLATGHILAGNAGTPTDTTVSGDVTIGATGVTAIGSGKVTSTMIVDGTILDADVNASAALSYSKLASLATGHILAGNAGTPTDTTLGGDATIGATGTLTIANLAITNAKIAATTIDLTAKVTGTLPATNGGTGFASYTIGDILSASSTTALSKVTVGTSNQLLQGNGVGNLPSWVTVSGDATNSNGAITLASTNANLGNLSKATGVAVHGTNTNDSAAAGFVGETLTGTLVRSSATSLTTSTSKTITSISVTAGDWQICGGVQFKTAAGTSVTSLYAAASLTTNTLPAADTQFVPTSNEIRADIDEPATVPGSNSDTPLPFPCYRASFSGTTNLFLVANATFSVSTMTGYGFIQATRTR